MNNLKIFCVTNLPLPKLEELDLNLAGVGPDLFPSNYINTQIGENIQYKEKHYSELTFHYWFWKNKLNECRDDSWIGFCQKRRFWVKPNHAPIKNLGDLNNALLRTIPKECLNSEAIICQPIPVSPAKKIKMIKRGWKNLLKDPTIFFDHSKQTIKLQFDMHHGYGILDKAINVMNNNDRNEFRDFVNNKVSFSPNIMFITKKRIMHNWFVDLFNWLSECEKIFGFNNLKGYDQIRLYAYLSERYLPFWFEKYTNSTYSPWKFIDINLLD
tara:strand:- start:968 stop:1777 length:810 start_codon:yes stop_codon:yes gene_type:complete